jgi:AcrR family transcriptional regulator
MMARDSDSLQGVTPESGSSPTGGSSESTRQSLMKCAEDLFARQGYDGTSVKEIADAAGVNISLISYHFKGKEGLYRACLETFGRSRLDVAKRLLEPANSSAELRIRVDMFVEEMFAAYAENPAVCKIIQREADLNLRVAQDIFRDTFMQVFETLVKFIAKSQERGALRGDVDPQLTAAVLYGGVVQLMHYDDLNQKFFNQSIRDPKYRAQVREHFLKLALEGLETRS